MAIVYQKDGLYRTKLQTIFIRQDFQMKISTKGRYGLRVMVELASHHGKSNSPVMMNTLAKNQGISKKYLHSLLTSLKSAGLVRAIRGANGGFVLARPPADILVSQVVLALEGSLSPVDCINDTSICNRSDYCVTREVWNNLEDAIKKVLSEISLSYLAKKQQALQEQRLMYHI
jgi:Rrf2 family protein